MAKNTSKRESILEYIRTTVLPKINGADPYNLSLKKVSRARLLPENLDYADYPTCVIFDDYPAKYKQTAPLDYTTGDDILDVQDGMIVGIVGYVTIDKTPGPDIDGTMSTEINKMFADIVTAFHTDRARTMGGLCQGFSMVGSLHGYTSVNKQQIGYVIVKFSIKYDFCPYNNVV